MQTITTEAYEARPLALAQDSPEAIAESAYKLNLLIRKAVRHAAFFSDVAGACECDGPLCRLEAPGCRERAAMLMRDLGAPDALAWEVWRKAPDVAFVGILRLTQVRPGEDATAHFFFFDGRLTDKMELLKAWREWVFSAHAHWTPLHRVTIEVPGYAYKLGHFAAKLGAGGPHRHPSGVPCEGWRREACLHGGKRYDRIYMGCLREEAA